MILEHVKQNKIKKSGAETVPYYVTALLTNFLQWKHSKAYISERKEIRTSHFWDVAISLLSQHR